MSPVLIALTFILTLVIPQSALTQAQLRYDSKTNHLLCPAPNKQYCAAASLQSSSIISCTQQGTAEIRSCEIELSSILPVGFERAGVCYESSLKSGDAVCAFNGTGYTREGLEVNAPETILCDGISSFSIIPPFAENHSKREGEGGTTSIEYFSSSQSPVPILRAHENLGQYPSYFPIQGTSRAPSLRDGIPSTLSRTSVDEEPSSICSNPWIRHEPRESDILTLNIILVIPTIRTDLIETHSEPYFSTTPSVLVSTTTISKASTALPSFCTTSSRDGMTDQDTQMSLSTVATLTGWAVPMMGCEDASRVFETGVPNSGNHSRKRTVVLGAGAVSMLTLWISAETLFS